MQTQAQTQTQTDTSTDTPQTDICTHTNTQNTYILSIVSRPFSKSTQSLYVSVRVR